MFLVNCMPVDFKIYDINFLLKTPQGIYQIIHGESY